MPKKLILSSVLLSFMTLLNAAEPQYAEQPKSQEPFLTALQKFENKDNKKITDHVRQVYTQACGLTRTDLIPYTASNVTIEDLGEPNAKTTAKACSDKSLDGDFINKLNLDNSAFAATYHGQYSLALFLMENNFSLNAYNNGDFFPSLIARMPFKQESAPAVEEILAKTKNLSDAELDEFITSPNVQTGANAVHNIAFFTPRNKNIKDIKTVDQNLQPSFQRMLLEEFVADEHMRAPFCKAVTALDKEGNTPFHTAMIKDNKEAFFNLAWASKEARCNTAEILTAISKENNKGFSVKEEAFAQFLKADKNKDSVEPAKNSFYAEVILMLGSKDKPLTAKQDKELKKQEKDKKNSEKKERKEKEKQAAKESKKIFKEISAEVSAEMKGPSILNSRINTPSGAAYKLDSKNPVPVTEDNISTAKFFLENDKKFTGEAVVKLNRWNVERDRAGDTAPETQKAKAEYLKMLEKDNRSPFYSFGANNDKETAAAFNEVVAVRKSNIEDGNKSKMTEKLSSCSSQQREMADLSARMEKAQTNLKELQTRTDLKLSKERREYAEQAYKKEYNNSKREYDKRQKNILKLQGEIVDGSGNKYTSDAGCFKELAALPRATQNAMASFKLPSDKDLPPAQNADSRQLAYTPPAQHPSDR